MSELHPALESGRTAVITGAASGIGLAAAQRCAGLGMRVVMVDIDWAMLERAREDVAALHAQSVVLAVRSDVSRIEEVEALKDSVLETFGDIALLMNNAGIEGGGGLLPPDARGRGGESWTGYHRWQDVLATNLWGVINGIQTMAPVMIDQGTDCAIVNTGSKQGITSPPGDFAYNTSKAAIKAVSEALAHELRERPDCRVTAHLLIPGFTYTGFTRRKHPTKPAAAWWPEEVIEYMLPRMARGDFYILCPDNDVDLETDKKRIAWAAGDIIENRPALSRWDARWKDIFARS